MRNRSLTSLAIIATVTVLAVAAAAVRVLPRGANTADPEGTSSPLRTVDGQPDLQGIWTNYDSTPFETFDPGDKPGLYTGDPDGTARGTGPASFPNDVTGRKLVARKSLVIDPPNGRVPIMPWAEERRNYALAHIADSWEYQTTWERCITRGVPGGIFPTGYGSGYQIVQTPGYVTILYEMIHETRIIPLDGRPHLGPAFRLWNGDSRGHWEGNTLVVDITNYNDKGSVATNAASQRVRAIPQSEALHAIERFTRIDEDTIDYQVTIEDPKVFTSPWTASMVLNREPDYQMFEYACHEGNQAMGNTLSAGRAKDKAGRPAKTR